MVEEIHNVRIIVFHRCGTSWKMPW